MEVNWCRLPKREERNFGVVYEPDIDDFPRMYASLASYYQYHIGILIWIVDFGRIDTNPDVLNLTYQFSVSREV